MFNEVVDGLEAGTNRGTADAPHWIDMVGRPEPRGLLVCRNGLVELDTGKLWDHDPRLFCLNSVDFDFIVGARAHRDGNNFSVRSGLGMRKQSPRCKNSSGCGWAMKPNIRKPLD